jgi:hypothetical protein
MRGRTMSGAIPASGALPHLDAAEGRIPLPALVTPLTGSSGNRTAIRHRHSFSLWPSKRTAAERFEDADWQQCEFYWLAHSLRAA